MIKAIIFDVDGTLLDTERIYMHAWKLAAKEAGYDLPDEVLLRTRAVSHGIADRIYKEAMGEDFSYVELRPARVRIAEEIIAGSHDLCKPGVIDTLEYLRSRGIPMAVASSTDREKTIAHLAHAGLLKYFGVVIGGDMVQKGKPAPDIFLKAAKELRTAAGECVVVEDSPAGIQAALAAGMVPVLIPDCVPENPQTAAMSAVVLNSMEQLCDFLEQY